MKDFCTVLSSLRKETGRSQRRAAADLGISQALLSHYENGVREPKLEFVVKACDYYNVPADFILGRVDEREQQKLPAPSGCENAPRLISAACNVFDRLDEMSSPEVYAAVVNYLLIPTEHAATLLSEHDMPYEPMRDVELKLAESMLLALVRKLTRK